MSAEIIALRPSQGELEQAWQDYDAAQRRAADLYRTGEGTAEERRAATFEAIRLHAALRKLIDRAEVA